MTDIYSIVEQETPILNKAIADEFSGFNIIDYLDDNNMSLEDFLYDDEAWDDYYANYNNGLNVADNLGNLIYDFIHLDYYVSDPIKYFNQLIDVYGEEEFSKLINNCDFCGDYDVNDSHYIENVINCLFSEYMRYDPEKVEELMF